MRRSNDRDQRRSRPPVPEFDNIPWELKGQARWLCWRSVQRSDGTVGKVPYNIADKRANFVDPTTWLPFEAVVRQYHRGKYDGIGVVLSGGLCGLDEDHCYDADGRLDDEAAANIQELNTYTEISVSGNGLHALAFGRLPPGGRRRGKHEMYSDKRYFVVTGRIHEAGGQDIAFRTPELASVHADIFKRTVQAPRRKESVNSEERASHCESVTQLGAISQVGEREEIKNPHSDQNSGTAISDDRVVAMILKDPVSRKYWQGCPPGMNPSRADFALAGKLAFYTGKILPQMKRLFLRSGLRRPKCFSRRGSGDYLDLTLAKACKCVNAVWRPNAHQRRTGTSPIGRPLSSTTKRVLELVAGGCSDAEIGRKLAIKQGTVRVIRHRHARPEVKDARETKPTATTS
jgi:putative DNA primase/helicase